MYRRIAVVILVVLIIGVLFYLLIYPKIIKSSSVNSQSSQATITTKANWDAGTLENVDSATVSGSIQISDKVEGQIDTTGMTATSPEPIDGNLGTYYGVPFGDSIFWQLDFGQEYYVSRVVTKKPDSYMGSINYSYSTNGVDWTSEGFTWDPPSGGVIVGEDVLGASFRYVKFDAGPPTPPGGWKIYEYEFYGLPVATHTTGSTQIDGGENLWDWETFTPTQTVPANTSVAYRYRSSADGANWNSWHSSFADVESTSGLTRYRYLQVEATLSNTDGASTPTIDAYDITYHTEQKPNKPTAQTATVQ